MNAEGRKPSRSYRPKVEALEALRLLDADLAAGLAPYLIEAQDLGPVEAAREALTAPTAEQAAWDAALRQTRLADLLEPADLAELVPSGLRQLERYLGRAWARAGIAPQQHEDCTQAVYLALLEQFGRAGFDDLAGQVGRSGVRDVLNRESPEGPDFFRAVDMIKKRCQRERAHSSLDEHLSELAEGAGSDGAAADWRGALEEAITRALTPREAHLIHATLEGKTPAEIAAEWGCAPKTVSNEKSRALCKLRESLLADLDGE